MATIAETLTVEAIDLRRLLSRIVREGGPRGTRAQRALDRCIRRVQRRTGRMLSERPIIFDNLEWSEMDRATAEGRIHRK